MPLNIPGLVAPFQLLWNPRVVLPHVIVADIRQLDFLALRKAGYRGAVFDKDNCLTIPYKDPLVPQLEDAWKECKEVFGDGNVLIVSNSAGAKHDAGQVQAESVSHYLSVPVLRHNAPKPAYSCIKSIRGYFSTLRDPIKDEELVIVGDRIFTDIVMANRMRVRPVRSAEGADAEKGSRCGPLAVWTTGVWQRESMMVRWLEKSVVDVVTRWTSYRSAFQDVFARPVAAAEESVFSRVLRVVRRK
ncbi:HAD-superfamily phosphatase [Imleria badia]|nr:HAD-superfamily phosphatase [Imleria badia]